MSGSKQDEPVSTRAGAWVGSAVAALVVLVLGVLVVREWSPLLSLDDTIDSAIHRWALQTPWAVDLARNLSTIGGLVPSVYLAIATIAVLLIARRWWTALTVGLVAALAPLLTDQIKNVVDRPRPSWAVSLATEVGPSYPSGHATGGIAVWAVCGVALASLIRDPSWAAVFALPWILVGIAIGLSRLVLGVHWPSDVVGGWCVALAVIGAAAALFVLPAARSDQRRLPAGAGSQPRLR
jgi:membrane-associated phospholipid phosphatase